MRWLLYGSALAGGLLIFAAGKAWAELPSKFQGNWCATQQPFIYNYPIKLYRFNTPEADWSVCELPQRTTIHEDTVDEGTRGVCTQMSAHRIDQDTYAVHITDICGSEIYAESDWIYHLEDGVLTISPSMSSAVGHQGLTINRHRSRR